MLLYLIKIGYWSFWCAFVFTTLAFILTGVHVGWMAFFENIVKIFFLVITIDFVLASLGIGQSEE
jgi:hypothetical protein